MVETVTREKLMAKINRGEDFVLVDALGPEHYESSHLPGAVNLPYEFVDEPGRVLPAKDAEIVVYCMNTGCSASKEEARELEEMGCSRVLHYAEGKQDWIRSPRRGRAFPGAYVRPPSRQAVGPRVSTERVAQCRTSW